jgi:hypothetical protein
VPPGGVKFGAVAASASICQKMPRFHGGRAALSALAEQARNGIVIVNFKIYINRPMEFY